MADTGFVFPGTAVGNRTISGSSADWGSPDNIKADDGSDATFDYASNGDWSSGLAASNFDFTSIPSGSTIDQIEVRIGDYKKNSSSAALSWNDCFLILADDSDGNEDARTVISPGAWLTTLQTAGTSGLTPLWGETISLSDVKDVDWGFFIGILGVVNSPEGGTVDFLQMKVFYTSDPIITDVNTTESWDDGDTGLVITGTNFV